MALYTARAKRFAGMLQAGTTESEFVRDKTTAELNDVTGKYPLMKKYCHVTIQFGYCTLFAMVFPLAPLMCLLANVVELRCACLPCTQLNSM